MKKNSLKVQVYGLKDLFSSFNRFVIPKYQRAYSWDKENWEQLWDDLTESCQEQEEHFLGNLVLCKGQGLGAKASVDIVDGQQRLTTLSILLLAIRNTLWERGSFSQAYLVWERFHVDPGYNGVPLYRLTLSRHDQPWFEHYAHRNIREDGNETVFPVPSSSLRKGIPKSQRLMWKAYNYFKKQVAELFENQQEGGRFLEYLSSDVLITATYLEDPGDAYALFECLNDRGVPLSVADLFKNFLLSQATSFTEEDREMLIKQWDDLEDFLKDCDLSDYFRHHWLSTRAKVLKRHLYRTMRQSIEAGKLDIQAYVEELKEESLYYKDIIGKGSPCGPKLDPYLEDLRALSFRVVHCLLLAVWTKHEQPNARLGYLRAIETFLIQFATFAGQVTNKLEPHFSRLAIAIRHGMGVEEMRAELNELLPSTNQVWEGFTESTYAKKVAQALLHRIEIHAGASPDQLAKMEAVLILPKRKEAERMDGLADLDGLWARREQLATYGLLPKDRAKDFAKLKSAGERLRYLAETGLPTQAGLGAAKRLDLDLLQRRQQALLAHAQSIWAWPTAVLA